MSDFGSPRPPDDTPPPTEVPMPPPPPPAPGPASGPVAEEPPVRVMAAEDVEDATGIDAEAVAEAAPPVPRWVPMVTTLGLSLAAVVTAQVLAAIAEGMSLRRNEPQGLPGDVFHHLGFPFRSLGVLPLVALVVAVILVSLPPMARERTTDRQELAAAVTLGLCIVMAVIIAIGSMLAVRYILHLYSATRRPTPAFVRLDLVSFLFGALGTAAVTLVGALAAMGIRGRRQEA